MVTTLIFHGVFIPSPHSTCASVSKGWGPYESNLNESVEFHSMLEDIYRVSVGHMANTGQLNGKRSLLESFGKRLSCALERASGTRQLFSLVCGRETFLLWESLAVPRELPLGDTNLRKTARERTWILEDAV